MRTGTESKHNRDKVINPVQMSSTVSLLTNEHYKLTIKDFVLNEAEREAMNELQMNLGTYMLFKHCVQDETKEKTFLNIQDYLSTISATHTERSNVSYIDILDAKSDSKDTLLPMLSDLKTEFVDNKQQQYLVLAADAKLYELLKAIKHEYGNEFKWLILYPGDWHMLKNYQIALMKPYFEAGLKHLAKAAGYPVAGIQFCSQFKKTHLFIMEVWETIFCSMLDAFLASDPTGEHLVAKVSELLANKCTGHEIAQAHHKLANENVLQEFGVFVQQAAQKDTTWKFWVQFEFDDALCYLGLFLSIRSGNWWLRMGCVKKMSALFTSLDHTTYQKVITDHLTEIANMPSSILAMFKQGAFVVSITGREFHSVGLDEAHKMLINKECKGSIVRPTPDNMRRTAHYLPYRAQSMQNFKAQILVDQKNPVNTINSPYSTRGSDLKFKGNVQAQMDCIKNYKMFSPTADKDRGLINPFTNKKANPEQQYDLINVRKIGEGEFQKRVLC